MFYITADASVNCSYYLTCSIDFGTLSFSAAIIITAIFTNIVCPTERSTRT